MIVVTGGAGFIGSHVVEALNDKGRSEIVIVDNAISGSKASNLQRLRFHDLIEKSNFRRQVALRRSNLLNIKKIYHLGACARTTETDVEFLMDNNYLYSKELLDFAVQYRIPFLYASSGAVYGQSVRCSEDPTFERPINAYALSKLALDNYARSIWSSSRSTIVGLRFFNVYGPREAHKGRMSSTIHHFLRQAQTSGVVRVFKGSGGFSDGEQRRDFVYVTDAVKASLHFGDANQVVHGIFNVGRGRSRTFNEVARCVIATLGCGRVEYVDFPEDLKEKYQHRTQADLGLLIMAGCPQPETELEIGVALTANAMELRHHDQSGTDRSAL